MMVPREFMISKAISAVLPGRGEKSAVPSTAAADVAQAITE